MAPVLKKLWGRGFWSNVTRSNDFLWKQGHSCVLEKGITWPIHERKWGYYVGNWWHVVLGNIGIQERLMQFHHAVPKEIQPQEKKGVYRTTTDKSHRGASGIRPFHEPTKERQTCQGCDWRGKFKGRGSKGITRNKSGDRCQGGRKGLTHFQIWEWNAKD